MIIGIDASRANRQYKSGTEWYAYHLIRELAKIDGKNQYILYTDQPLTNGLVDLTLDQGETHPYPPLSGKGNQEIISPFHNFRCKIIKQFLPFFWTQLNLSLEMLFHPPDVLFIPSHTLPIIHQRKSVVTIHDVGFVRDHKLYGNKRIGPTDLIRGFLLNWLVKIISLGKYGANIFDYHVWSTKFALKHAKKIITVSQFSKKEIEEIYSVDSKKIQVIYHGYDNNLYQPMIDFEKINQVLNKYGIKQPYIFYAGRLEKKKNTPTLIEAYAIMREKHKNIKHKLVLIGNAGYGFDEVNYTIHKFNIDKEIILTGWMAEEDMPFIYNGAKAFIFPSCYEGFGIPLLQAMACNTAIVASNIPAVSEVVKDSALLFDPFNKIEMAEAMTKIIIDDNLRHDLIAKGQGRVKNFSWEKCARETLAVLENL
ncbi:MAG: glycosyltransferase family 1 protein [Patescibacteria group bacterium]